MIMTAQFDLQQQDFQAAEQTLRRVIDIAPGSIEAYRFLGQTLLKQNKLEQARVELENNVKRDPRAIGSRTAIGVIYALTHDEDAAVKQYEAVLQIDPRAAIAANNLAWIYAQRGEKLQTAARLAQSAQLQLPDRLEVADTLGFVYYQQNLIQLAIPPLQNCVTKAPNYPMCRLHLGLALAKTKNLEQAKVNLEAALRLDPKIEGGDEARRLLTGLKLLDGRTQ
jgi:Tfp pilus assembly protein PilF